MTGECAKNFRVMWEHATPEKYLDAGIGLSYFVTSSSVSGTSNDEDFASSRNFHDWAFTWRAGGGLRVRLARQVGVDLGTHYVRNGRVRYLREGGIQANPDGSLTIDPIESETNLLVFQIGVAFLIGGEAEENE